MNKITIFFVLLTMSYLSNAQQAEYYFYTLSNKTPLKAKIMLRELKNTGEESEIDINTIFAEKVKEIAQYTYTGNSKTHSANVWLMKPILSFTNNIDEADVVISGNYQLKKSSFSQEKLMYESSTKYSTPIPYYEAQTTNKVEMTLEINYQYKQSSFQDTIRICKEVKRKPKKKFKSLIQLQNECLKTLDKELYSKLSFIERNKHFYKFPKLKIKNKALKDEFKNATTLLETGEVLKLGNLYQRIYNDKPSKEAALCLGICYELIGNYPKASEYYKQNPDFHTKVRMKNSMKLYDYLLQMNVVIQNKKF